MATAKNKNGDEWVDFDGNPVDPNRTMWNDSDSPVETVVFDPGYIIKLNGDEKKPDVFVGKYLGTRTITIEGRSTKQLLFEDNSGARCNMFANYALEQALESDEMVPGVLVRIKHFGKVNLPNGRSFNRLTVQFKKA